MKKFKLDFTPIFLLCIALMLALLAWRKGGSELALAGLKSGSALLLHELPLLLAAFLTAGLIQSLVKKETVEHWLGAESGWRGIALACIGGALIPGGPYVYYPIAGALLHTGAGLGVLIAFVSAKNLWSISRIPLEVALLGPRVTIVRFLVTLAIPPLFGFVAETLFGKTIEHIRIAMKKTSAGIDASEVSEKSL